MADPIAVRLVNPDHKMRMPRSRRFFGEGTGGIERVNPEDPFWRLLLADRSIEPVPAEQSKPDASELPFDGNPDPIAEPFPDGEEKKAKRKQS